MNQVELREIKNELGEEGLFQLKELKNRIYNSSASCFSDISNFRFAPSIITRSEAEIFNLAIPRFAIRVYLDKSKKSFVNARRIGTFSDQAKNWSIRRYDNNKTIEKVDKKKCRKSPAWVLRKNTCIGDCVLQPPAGFSDDKYHVLRTELGKVYGEMINKREDDILGTPYMKHIPLSGGGLCAQAVCFMATVLLHQYARGVFGLAEITALAEKITTGPYELILTGLSQKKIANYFSHERVGLHAVWQWPTPWNIQSDTKISLNRQIPLESEIKAYNLVLRSYLFSNMPVILTVDAGRQADSCSSKYPLIYSSIIKENKLDKKQCLNDPYEIRTRHHAIILVGCDYDSGSNNMFLFNDPSIFPFMKASARQLWDTVCYEDNEMSGPGPHCILAVTPTKVRMPLSRWLPNEELINIKNANFKPGLLDLAKTLQSGIYEKNLPYLQGLYNPGELRLTLMSQIKKIDILRNNDGKKFFDNWYKSKVATIMDLDDHWCWVQYLTNSEWDGKTTDSVWIWDAEKETKSCDQLDEVDKIKSLYLIDVFVRDGGKWKTIQENTVKSSGNITKNASTPRNTEKSYIYPSKLSLQKSLITSFSVDGIKDAFDKWPEGLENCDLYTFMQKDAERLLKTKYDIQKYIKQYFKYTIRAKLHNVGRRFPIHTYVSGGRLRFHFHPKRLLGINRPILDTAERMAILSTDPRGPERCAKYINNECMNNCKITAFASFLPGIAFDPKFSDAVNAKNALLFLVRLARELKSKYEHPIHTIEMVAGSMISGTWPGILKKSYHLHEKDRYVYVANLVNREEAISFLLDNIAPVAEKALKADINLAIELEPGPYFVLNDWDALKTFCNKLDLEKYKRISPAMGLNLDIAHWTLADIPVKELAMNEKVYKRIVHCHISDHHGHGHFADTSIGLINEPSLFRAWLELIASLNKERASNYPKFHSTVAIELEACKHEQVVIDSTNSLENLLRKKQTPIIQNQYRVENDKIKFIQELETAVQILNNTYRKPIDDQNTKPKKTLLTKPPLEQRSEESKTGDYKSECVKPMEHFEGNRPSSGESNDKQRK